MEEASAQMPREIRRYRRVAEAFCAALEFSPSSASASSTAPAPSASCPRPVKVTDPVFRWQDWRRRGVKVRGLGRGSCRARLCAIVLGLLGPCSAFSFWSSGGTPAPPGRSGKVPLAAAEDPPRFAATDGSEALEAEGAEDGSKPWDQLVTTASVFFRDTLQATLHSFVSDEVNAGVAAANETDFAKGISELLLSSPGASNESLADLQEALLTQSQSLTSFAEQSKSLEVKPPAFLDSLGAVFRSIRDVEERVAKVVGEALTSARAGDRQEEDAQSLYGLAVHDSAARRGLDGGWVVPLQAWMYRRNERRHHTRMSLARKLVMEMTLGINNISEAGLKRFEDRGRLIFRTLAFRGGERNVVLSVKFDGEEEWRELPPTGGNGRVQVDVTVPEQIAKKSAVDGILGFAVRIPAEKACGQDVIVHGSALLYEPEGGVLVISDIDDTVKVTEVFLGNDMVIRNTFLEEFRPVTGMAELYAKWAQEFGADFTFVSNSPPELQEPLREFLLDSGFPRAPVHLRPLSGSKEERRSFKPRTISELLLHYPRRKVVLVGDSGERDPEICADLLRRHPAQVVKVLIRQVSPNSPVDESVFAGIPSHRWQVFTDPNAAQLPDELRDLGSVPGILSLAASLGSAALRTASGGDQAAEAEKRCQEEQQELPFGLRG